MRSYLRLIVFFGGAIGVLLVLTPLHIIALIAARLGWTFAAGWLPVLFHRSILWLIGIQLTLDGKVDNNRPLLFVSNHVSWLDIVVLGAISPLSFVAKSEMKSWPVFGWLAMLQRTVFIRREDRRNAGHQASEIAQRMVAREIIVLFPEGTTSDGNMLYPFKTPLFEAAKLALRDSPVDEAIVQPVAIEYTKLNGLHLGRAGRPHVAWPGDIGLAESLLPIVKVGALDVTVHLGAPIALTETSNRKIVAAQSADAIRNMLNS